MSSQVGNASALPDTNPDFLRAVFGNDWERAHVTGVPGDPQDPTLDRSYWFGAPASVARLSPAQNNYFAVSLFTGRRRVKDEFNQLWVLGVDDVGPKVSAGKVVGLLGKPTYRIETSPGNEQWGYVLEQPITVEDWGTRLIQALITALVGPDGKDPGMAGVTRYLRLPVGKNLKPEYGSGGFQVRLLEMVEDRRLDWIEVSRLCRDLGVLVPDQSGPASNEPLSDGMSGSTVSPGGGGQSSVPGGPGAGGRSQAWLDDLVERDLWFQAMKKLDLVLGGPRNSRMQHAADKRLMTWDIVCPWTEAKDGQGHTGGMQAVSGTAYVPVLGRFECHHGHCRHRTGEHLSARLDELLQEQSGGTVRLVDVEFPDLSDADRQMRASPPGAKLPGGFDDLWRDDWQRSARGAPASNLFNVLHALRHAPDVAGLCSLNEFSMRGVLLREVPGVPGGKWPVPREWRDEDTMALHVWLQGQGLRTVGLAVVEEAVATIMRDNAHHPLRDWLASLVWDGIPRIDSWLADYAGAPRDVYHAHVGAWFLMGMCRRVAEPGCRMDYMLILEGPQGIGKSTMLRTLAGRSEWFSDNLPDISTKEASEHLAGCWLVEIAEMDRFNRAESSAMKAFVSRPVDRHRLPFSRRTGDFPRQCVLTGTVNQGSYFKDETGNRRYWPVSTSTIDNPGLSAVRDQLFAEAWHRAVTLSEPYWPDPLFEELVLEPMQDQRLEADPWETVVRDYLKGRDRVLINEVVVACTGGGSDRMSTFNRNRVTSIMGTLRWKRGTRGNSGERFWYPAGTSL